MRCRVGPGEDVEIDEGTTAARCRVELARLTGEPAWARVPLAVDGHTLGDDHVAGLPPWVQGAHLTAGPGDADPWQQAAAAPWHCAVVDGPDAGLVAVPGRDGSLTVGRTGTQRAGRLVLTDLTVSRDHAVVTARGGAGRRRWSVRELGSANGTRVVRVHGGRRIDGAPEPGPSRARRVPRRGPLRRRTARPDDLVRLGSTTLVLRGAEHRSGPSVPPTSPPNGSTGRGGPGAQGVGHGVDRSPPPTPAVATWLLPGLASLALAVVLRNPVFLVLALAGPLGLALPALTRALRRPRVARDDLPVLAPDPTRTAVDLARAPAGPGTAPRSSAGAEPVAGGWTRAADGLAVVGPRDLALATVRSLLGAALLDDDVLLTLLHPSARTDDWAWARWLGRRVGGPGSAWVVREPSGARAVLRAAPDRLVVADGLDWGSALGDWWRERPAGPGIVLLAGDARQVPAWCRWVAAVAPDGSTAIADRLVAASPVHVLAAPASPRWLEEHARRIAGRDALRAAGAEPVLPHRVSLADCGVPGDLETVLRSWDRKGGAAPPGLRAALGVTGTGSPLTVDLVAQGPHLLVAGTTGSGKSELLQSLVLGLALSCPPTEVTMVLVDYKGGASFGPCRGLPHVLGEVTDLDQAEAARALDGLRAELRRRELLLARAGVGDLDQLRHVVGPAVAPPRLVVVVDEFRALTEDLPDFVPRLVRIAAQGRSLGIHLVLATQRPAGAVSAELRANMALRICLRVTDGADSSDVVDVPDAALIPADRPGRALLRRAAGAPEVVQTAWAALPPNARAGAGPVASATTAADRAGGRTGAEAVRPAVAWSSFGPPSSRGPDAGRDHRGPERPDHGAHLVEVVREAARVAGHRRPDPVWLPPLPMRVEEADLPPAFGHAAVDPGWLPLALTDLPVAQRRGVLLWSGRAPLAVAGHGGTGRTTVLRVAARAALARGWHVHAIEGTASVLRGVEHPGVGTVVGPDDPRRLARLLTALCTPAAPGAPRRLLVVDDVGAVQRALDLMPRGMASELLDRVLRTERAVVVAGSPRDLVRLLPLVGERLVLGVADPHDDALLGVPRAMAGGRANPGRAVHLAPAGDRGEPDGTAGRDDVTQREHDLAHRAGGPATSSSRESGSDGTVVAVRCQVVRPADDAPGLPRWDATSSAGAPGGAASAPLRLAPLPLRVPRPPVIETSRAPGGGGTGGAGGPVGAGGARGGGRAASAGRVGRAAGDRLWVDLGLGGDSASPVGVTLASGLLVVGPPG
ncbi:MAG: hypothetical protein JWP95_932, partial [Actinotalea sp.]|nr:hypothetical protein [Actinotalea sp.]